MRKFRDFGQDLLYTLYSWWIAVPGSCTAREDGLRNHDSCRKLLFSYGYTVCPRSSDPIYIVSRLLYKIGHYFSDI